MENTGRRNSVRRPTQYRENLPEEKGYAPPRNGWITTIIIGLVGGAISLLPPIGVVYTNASLYREGSRLGENMPPEVASSIFWRSLGGGVGGIFIVFLFGAIAGGFTSVTRWKSFVAGGLAGIIAYLGIFFAHYIPNYPDVISKGATTSATGTWLQGVVAFLILLVIYALVGGLASLGGRSCGLWVRRLFGK